MSAWRWRTGYTPIAWLFESLGLDVVTAPVDDEGVVVDGLPADVRLVYTTPSHQYPLGMAQSLPRRLHLLEWAERTGAAIVEDDYDSEFRIQGKPIEPLRALDETGRVIYVGSFSKTTLPALRLGFVIAPPSLRTALRRAKFVADWHSPVLMQRALAAFIDDGGFASHIRRMNRVYERRHRLLLRVLRRDLSEHLEPVPADAGLHVSALARRLDVPALEAVAERAADRGVQVQLLSRFRLGETARAGLMLGYGGVEIERMEEGLALLRECFD